MRTANVSVVQVSDQIAIDAKTAVDNVESGVWTVHDFGDSKLYLHQRLGIEVASTLAIWENLDAKIKVTKNESDRIIGIAIRG